MRKLHPLIAVLGLAALCACSSQATNDINAVLGNSAASTAVAYVASLDPTVQSYMQRADAAIATDAPKVLSTMCGAVSMSRLVVNTVSAIDATLVPHGLMQEIDVGFAAIDKICPPNRPPANVADAARMAMQLYGNMREALHGAGVKL